MAADDRTTEAARHGLDAFSDPTSGWPSLSSAWYANTILTLAFVLAFIDRQIIALLVGPIQADFKISDTQVSLLGGFAFIFIYTFLGIPIGRIVDRSNRRRLIAVGVFFWSLMTVACGVTKNFTQLFLARIGVGVGEATLSPAALSILSDYFPPKRLGFAVSVYLSGAAIGTGLAFLLGGAALSFFSAYDQVTFPILGELKSWQFAFIVVGSPGLLFSLLVMTFAEPKRQRTMAVKQDVKGGGQVTLSDAIKFLYERRGFYLNHFLGFGFYLAFTYGLSFWAIEYFVRTFAVERSQAAYVYGAQVILCGGIGTLLAGWLSDWLERKGQLDAKLRVAFWPILPMIALIAVLPFVDRLEISYLVIMAITFLWKFPLAPAAAILQIATPNEVRGFATGLYLFIGNTLGLAIGPAVIGVFSDYVVGDQSGIRWSIALAGLLMLPVALFCIRRCRTVFRDGRAPTADDCSSPQPARG